jgi:hypothetical protein
MCDLYRNIGSQGEQDYKLVPHIMRPLRHVSDIRLLMCHIWLLCYRLVKQQE